MPTPAVNVAVVFSGSAYQQEIKGRLSRENFLDLPLEVNPITVLVNNTNPRALLTRICDTLTANRVHGVVFEDNVGSEAVAQILDFISTQTAVPIVGISGGSAVVLPYKVGVRVEGGGGSGGKEGGWGGSEGLACMGSTQTHTHMAITHTCKLRNMQLFVDTHSCSAVHKAEMNTHTHAHTYRDDA